MKSTDDQTMANLALQIKQWGLELGFQQQVAWMECNEIRVFVAPMSRIPR